MSLRDIKKVSKRTKKEIYMDLIVGYSQRKLQDLECYVRTEVDSVENDNRLVLAESKSSVNSYEKSPGISTSKDLSEVVAIYIHRKVENSYDAEKSHSQ